MSQRYFEDVSVGDELEPVEKIPTDEVATQFFAREGEPASTPERLPVSREGFSGVLVPGLLKVSWLTQYVSDWAGPAGRVRTVRVAYRRPDATNAPLVLTGNVVAKREEDGRHVVEIEVATMAEDGPSVRGAAQVELPARG